MIRTRCSIAVVVLVLAGCAKRHHFVPAGVPNEPYIVLEQRTGYLCAASLADTDPRLPDGINRCIDEFPDTDQSRSLLQRLEDIF